jgi:hypothetical protein
MEGEKQKKYADQFLRIISSSSHLTFGNGKVHSMNFWQSPRL